jgi:hypothetical protein
MWDDFIAAQIRRTNRNILLTGLAMLAIVGAIVGACWREAYNFVLGPFPMQHAELTRIWNPDLSQRYFVKVHGDRAFTTGAQEVDANNHDLVRAEFIALAVDNRLLLVRTPVNTGYEGTLTAIPNVASNPVDYHGTLAAIPNKLQTQFVTKWDQKHPELKGAFLPYMLDAAGSFRNQDNILAALGAVFMGGLGLFLLVTSIWRRVSPDQHPLLKKLAQYGPARDVRMRIDSELRAEGGGEKFGDLKLTSNWVIHAAQFTTTVMAAPDVVWAYPKVTKHYHSGIPTGKTFSAIIRDAKGQSVEVSGKKDIVPQMLAAIKRRLPSVVIGYTQELEHLWRRDRPKLLQMLQQQRRPA